MNFESPAPAAHGRGSEGGFTARTESSMILASNAAADRGRTTRCSGFAESTDSSTTRGSPQIINVELTAASTFSHNHPFKEDSPLEFANWAYSDLRIMYVLAGIRPPLTNPPSSHDPFSPNPHLTKPRSGRRSPLPGLDCHFPVECRLRRHKCEGKTLSSVAP